jgi:alpha-N-arabinofuranosidase
MARAQDGPWVQFDSFHYEGKAVGEQPTGRGELANPILAGMYPDPSVVRVGKDFYLVNSTFAWYPGVPIFHSTDLIHWTQIGFVLDRPSQLKLDGLQVSQGVFAPSLRYHDGLFYMINTLVGGINNFYVTAKNPAGPWSDPIRLPEIDGIDPSFFFDDDGKAYIVHNGPPPDNKLLYDGHRAIWLVPFDTTTCKVSGAGRILVNGGVDITKKPAWIEGPHLFHHDGFYYLIAAEGGTSVAHSEVVFRSPTLAGSFVPYAHNPILTQRDLDPNRLDPIADTGHADFVDDSRENWWAVFLGVEPYSKNFFNTGRETFMAPVTWQDGWPMILPSGKSVPRVLKSPGLSVTLAKTPGLQGSFAWNDDFHETALRPEWQMLRTPAKQWWNLIQTPGSLLLQARSDDLTGRGNPSFLGHRQQQMDFATTVVLHVPQEGATDAGLVAFQNEHAYFFFGVCSRPGSPPELFLAQGAGTEAVPIETRLQQIPLPPQMKSIELKITGQGGAISFLYRMGSGQWVAVVTGMDATNLSTSKAGGFVGTFLGPFARVHRVTQ